MENILASVIVPIFCASLPIIASGKLKAKSGFCLDRKDLSKQLREKVCLLELANNQTDIKHEIAMLKMVLDYEGLVEIEKCKHHKYVWDQIHIVEMCENNEDSSRQLSCLVELVRLAIYQAEANYMEDKKKKILLIVWQIAEILSLVLAVISFVSEENILQNPNILTVIAVYNCVPVLCGLMAIKRHNGNMVCKILYNIGIIILFSISMCFVLINDSYFNVFCAELFVVIMCLTEEIFDFSKYSQIEKKVENHIEGITSKWYRMSCSGENIL